VALTDGGNGLERVLRQGVSQAVEFVLDWWHLSQKLHELGGLIHEQQPGAARRWTEAREQTLWDHGGAAQVRELDRLGCPPAAPPAAQEKWREVRNHGANVIGGDDGGVACRRVRQDGWLRLRQTVAHEEELADGILILDPLGVDLLAQQGLHQILYQVPTRRLIKGGGSAGGGPGV